MFVFPIFKYIQFLLNNSRFQRKWVPKYISFNCNCTNCGIITINKYENNIYYLTKLNFDVTDDLTTKTVKRVEESKNVLKDYTYLTLIYYTELIY